MFEKDKNKMKIGHALEDLQDNIVLTLKDQQLIKKGNDNKLQLNEQDDILENLSKRQDEEAAYNSQLKKKLQRVANAATSHLEGETSGGILPHYDNYHYKGNQIELDEEGQIKKNKKLPDGKMGFNNRRFKNAKISDDYGETDQTAVKIGSQYTHLKSKTTVPKKESSKQLLNFLNETAIENIGQDDGPKRPLQIDSIINSSLDTVRKKVKLQQNMKADIGQINNLVDNEEQLLLQKSIQKSRKIRQQRQQRKKQNQNLLSIIKEQNDIDQKKDQNGVEIELNPISFKQSDFKIKRQQTSLNMINKGGGTSSVMFTALPSELIRSKKKQDNQLPESFDQLTPQQLEKMRKQVQFLQDTQVGIGLAGTLQYLRENSLLRKQEYAGRAKDKNPQSSSNSDDRIKLQYRNASGQLMKPKQAFRYLCAAFHGEGPGKNKIQKRKKREMIEVQMKQKSNTEGTLMKLLTEHQKKNNSAHMTIEFGSKKK